MVVMILGLTVTVAIGIGFLLTRDVTRGISSVLEPCAH